MAFSSRTNHGRPRSGPAPVLPASGRLTPCPASRLLRTFTLLDPFVARVVGQPPPGHLVDILLAPGRCPTRVLQVLVVPRRALGRPQGRQSGYECLIRFPAGRTRSAPPAGFGASRAG